MGVDVRGISILMAGSDDRFLREFTATVASDCTRSSRTFLCDIQQDLFITYKYPAVKEGRSIYEALDYNTGAAVAPCFMWCRKQQESVAVGIPSYVLC